jgi:hypothetical protein
MLIIVRLDLKENADNIDVLENVDYYFKHADIISTEIIDVITDTDLWELYLKKAPQKIARAASGGTLDGYREMGQKIAGLEAERDYLTKQLLTIRAHAGDATEYVLAQINKELVEERDHLQTEFDSLAKSFLKSGEDKHNLITERDELRALLKDMKAAVDRGRGTPLMQNVNAIPLWAFGERIKAALGDPTHPPKGAK